MQAVVDRPVVPFGVGAPRLPVPSGPAELAAHYDLTISHPEVDEAGFAAFDCWLARLAAEAGLSCALIHKGIVDEVARRLATGLMRVGYHLDYYALWHHPGDPYARLAEAIEDAGGRSVNSPARARTFTDKAAAHGELLRHGLGVPPTVLLRPWVPDRPLTEPERALLRLDEPGARLYIKPANGFGGRGVVRVERTDPDGVLAALTQARQADRQESYLVQREVRPPLLPCEDGRERPAYWRVLCCLGEWLPFWWTPADRLAPGQFSYHPVSGAELRRYRLKPVLDYARALGELSGLEWFSTELCLGDSPDASCFTVTTPDGQERPVLAIDYLNDQCAVDVQSRWAGAVPDRVVHQLALRFVEAAWRRRQQTIRPAAAAGYRLAA
jgi:hypothetical protein